MRDPLHICLHLAKHYRLSARELQSILNLKSRTFYNFIKGHSDKVSIEAYRNLLEFVDALKTQPTSPDISIFLPEQIEMNYVVDRQTPFGKSDWYATKTPPSFNPVNKNWVEMSINAVPLNNLLQLPVDEKPLNMRLYIKEGGIWRRF